MGTRGGLNLLLGLFGVVMSPPSASHRPKQAYEMFRYHCTEFQTHAFHVALSMGPTVSVVNLQGWQNSLQKSKPVNQAW